MSIPLEVWVLSGVDDLASSICGFVIVVCCGGTGVGSVGASTEGVVIVIVIVGTGDGAFTSSKSPKSSLSLSLSASVVVGVVGVGVVGVGVETEIGSGTLMGASTISSPMLPNASHTLETPGASAGGGVGSFTSSKSPKSSPTEMEVVVAGAEFVVGSGALETDCIKGAGIVAGVGFAVDAGAGVSAGAGASNLGNPVITTPAVEFSAIKLASEATPACRMPTNRSIP